MTKNSAFSGDFVFAPTVKATQTRKASRHGNANIERRGSWRPRIA